MSQHGDEILRDGVDPAPELTEPAAPPAPVRGQSPGSRGGSGLALLLAVLAAAGAGYSVWRVHLLERGDHLAEAEVRQRLDAADTRLSETERRSARNNELAATLRDQLAEGEQLRERMREDMIALAERGARAEALLADMARERRGGRAQLALADADLLLAQAQARLQLFDDRAGAAAALALADQALAESGADGADLRAQLDLARTALTDDDRPGMSALLAELDAIDGAVAALPLAPRQRTGETGAGDRGWWDRQFDRLDQLVTIRREDDGQPAATPTRDGVRAALARARLAALEQDHGALATALQSARTALAACCEPAAAAAQLARLDRLLAVDWQRPVPELGNLRRRLDDLRELDRLPSDGPRLVPMPDLATPRPLPDEDSP